MGKRMGWDGFTFGFQLDVRNVNQDETWGGRPSTKGGAVDGTIIFSRDLLAAAAGLVMTLR